jgi:hypothetical protein
MSKLKREPILFDFKPNTFDKSIDRDDVDELEKVSSSINRVTLKRRNAILILKVDIRNINRLRPGFYGSGAMCPFSFQSQSQA